MKNFQNDFSEFKREMLLAIQGVYDDNRQTRDLLQQEIRAAKTELRQGIKTSATELRQEMHLMQIEIIDSVNQIVNDGLLPQIDDHEHRLVKLEAKSI